MSPAKPRKKTAADQPSPAKARAAARAAELEVLRFEIESAWERRAMLTPEEIEGATRPAVDRAIAGLEQGACAWPSPTATAAGGSTSG